MMQHRRPVVRLWPLWFLLAVVAGCGASSAGPSDLVGSVDATAAAVEAPDAASSLAPTQPVPSPTALPEAATARPAATPTVHPIAAADTTLPPAPVGFEVLSEAAVGPYPVSLRIESLAVVDAAVIPVGVNEDLTFEVPPADQVGWYRFGPSPGAEGSAVLAAHIAFDGVDGVFRYLSDVEVGSIVVVGFSDGSSQRYRIEEVTDYLKQELPDSLFARTGPSQLALITCGGTFNPQLRSYESNTVAVAVPV